MLDEIRSICKFDGQRAAVSRPVICQLYRAPCIMCARERSRSIHRHQRRRPSAPHADERTGMGSAASREAVSSIRNWAVTEGRKSTSQGRATELFGSLVFSDEVQRARLPKQVYKALRRTITQGRAARSVGRRRRRVGDEGLGARARRHPLHPLVPAADRHHRREARLLPVARRPRAARSPSSAARN